MENNEKQNIELAVHQEKFKKIESDIDEIKENLSNHVSKIYRKLDTQQRWLVGVLVSIIFTLVGVVISIFT